MQVDESALMVDQYTKSKLSVGKNQTTPETVDPLAYEKRIIEYVREMDGKKSKKSEAKNDFRQNNLDSAVQDGYNEGAIEKIKSRNGKLEGQKHPATGVPFERRTVEINGKKFEVVMPAFESKYAAKLPKEMYELRDRKQFKECNIQLREEIAKNEELRKQFTEEQLKLIEKGKNLYGYTWHHDAEEGIMQLVESKTHEKTAHTGGRNFWGGGTEKR